MFCRGGDRLPGVGLWRRQAAQASGITGGGAPGSRRGEASAPVERQFIQGDEKRGNFWCEIMISGAFLGGVKWQQESDYSMTVGTKLSDVCRSE